MSTKERAPAQAQVRLVEERDTDRDFLAGLYASTRIQELEPVPWPEHQKMEFLRTQFEAQDHHYREHYADTQRRLIHVDDVPAGRLYIQRRQSEHRIVDIALLPQYRGSGIGSGLLGDVLDEAAHAGKAVRIHVEKNNPAYHLYKRLGFQTLEDKGVYDLLEWRSDS